MFGRTLYLQCRRFILSPIFWICAVIFAVIMIINSNIAIADRAIGADIIYAYNFAAVNTEVVVLSFLPSLPFALSYMEEKKEHSLRLSYIRCAADNYVTAKFIAVVLSGFCVAFIGSLLYSFLLSIIMLLIIFARVF